MGGKKQDYSKPTSREVAISTISVSVPGTFVGIVFIVVNKRGKVLSSWIIQSSRGDRQ